jgi:hypothetical protein
MKMDFNYPSDAYLKRLGMVTISFSDLEWSLRSFLEVIVSPLSKLGTILSAHLPFSRLLDVISSMYAHQWPDCARREELEVLLKRCQKAEEERNSIVHSSYGFPDDTPNELLIRAKSTAKRKHGLRHTEQKISIPELDRYLAELVDTNTAVMEFAFWALRTYQQKPNR